MAYIRSTRRDKQDDTDFVFMIQYILFYYDTICYMLHVQVTSVHVACAGVFKKKKKKEALVIK